MLRTEYPDTLDIPEQLFIETVSDLSPRPDVLIFGTGSRGRTVSIVSESLAREEIESVIESCNSAVKDLKSLR